MTGGGTGGCLQTLESGGMGEGWSDMMAVWMGQTSEKVEDFKIGTYFSDSGLRSRPYSTDEWVGFPPLWTAADLIVFLELSIHSSIQMSRG